MKLIKMVNGKMVDGFLFAKDDAKIFKGNGYIKVHFDMRTSTAEFIMPANMFGMPDVGDFIDTVMNSGKILRSVVTSFNQDWNTAKGKLHCVCYKEDFKQFAAMSKQRAETGIGDISFYY